MKKTRLFLSLLLCACLLLGAAGPTAAENSEARLYNVYGDHMLFQQQQDAVFAGEAAPGTALTATLTDKTGAAVCKADGTAGEDGTFSLSFPAPAGSFDSYTVTLTAGGETFCTLSDVVFGELWLSFGQSNMEYSLALTPEGKQMQSEGKTASAALRVLQVPHPVKNGVLCADALPQTDAQNSHWFTGDKSDVFAMSAAAYFFAEKMLADLQMPIGILNAAVGGSGIGAWISREAFASDAAATEALKAHGAYIALEDWNKGARQFHTDMTGLYNSKIAPLTNFRPAGGIWYQGETDLMLYNDPAYYEQLFTLLQDSYTAAFAHESGRLPLVFTQLVTYSYGLGPYAETKFNEAFTRLAAADPASRGEVVISDLSPDFYADCGAIHPMTKKPIGERMANCAQGLLYGSGAPTSAPAMSDAIAQGEDVLVTFSNVGDGLIAEGTALRGFAVYGADGVCCRAEAEIVSADTVRVYSDAVKAPVGAVYAANSLSPGANLWSSLGGAPYLPAAAFGAGDPAVTKLFDDAEWLRCETLSAWQNGGDPGLKDTWTASGADLSVSDDAAEGSGALKISANKLCFSASAPFAQQKDRKKRIHDSLDTDFSRWGTLSVTLKNTGKKNVTLSQLRFYKGNALYYCPLCSDTNKNSAVIPADGAWHTYTFDLNALGLYGCAAGRCAGDVLTDITELRLCFFGKDAEVQLDDFRFAPQTQSGDDNASFLQRVVARFLAAFQKIKAFLSSIVSA